MPRTKDALSRYKVIDQELRKNRPVSSKYLAGKCSEKLGKPVSVRTIQKDLDDMKNDTGLNMNAAIGYDAKKKMFYYNPDAPLVIFPSIALSDEETYALLFYTKATSHFKNYKIFGQMLRAIEKVLDATNISKDLRNAFSKEAILETESPLPSRGVEMIKDLVLAVRQRRVIKFTYKRFEETDSRERSMKPLLIKESEELWYIIGLLDSRPHPITFAIDRMSNLVVTHETFEPVEFNAEEHFRFTFGITAMNTDAVDVVLSFTKAISNYLKVVPIHPTQQILADSDTEFKIQVRVRPSPEFYKKILGFGEGVTIVSPPEIAERIKKSLTEALKKY